MQHGAQDDTPALFLGSTLPGIKLRMRSPRLSKLVSATTTLLIFGLPIPRMAALGLRDNHTRVSNHLEPLSGHSVKWWGDDWPAIRAVWLYEDENTALPVPRPPYGEGR
jgi:hypothetical protein